MEQTRYKTFDASDLEVKAGSREVTAVISTDDIDRDQEIVLPKGMNKKNFAGNPVVLLNHDWNKLPIGKALWVKQDGNKIIAKYKISDKTQEARDVFGLLQDGILTSHSISFMATEQSPPSDRELKSNPQWSGAKNVIRKFELLEFSVVGLPCNPNSVALSVAKGLSPSTLAFLGELWKPQPAEEDCWQWPEEDLEKLKTKEVSSETVAAAYKIPPEPVEPERVRKFIYKWADINSRITRLLGGFQDPDQLMKRLKGEI